MVTIRMMASLGPWTLTHIDDLGRVASHCERCGEPIRYVWVLELAPARPGAEPTTCRIGSKCGPTLENMSAELWKTAGPKGERLIRLAARLTKILSHSNATEAEREFASTMMSTLGSTPMTDREIKLAGWRCADIEKLLKMVRRVS